MTKKQNYAFQNHIDLDFLGKPKLDLLDFKEDMFLTQDKKRLLPLTSAAGVLVNKSRLLKNFISYKNTGFYPSELEDEFESSNKLKEFGDSNKLENSNRTTNHVYIYIESLGVYAACKKCTLISMLAELFLQIELDKKIKEQLLNENFDFVEHLEIDYDPMTETNEFLLAYAFRIVYEELDEFSSLININENVYCFRNFVKKHVIYDDSHDWNRYATFVYLNIDYSDDLILLPPKYYDFIYLNSEGYFYMPYDFPSNDDRLNEIIHTV